MRNEIIEGLFIRQLPANDLAPLADSSLTEGYEKLADKILGHNAKRQEIRESFKTLIEAFSVGFDEVHAAKADLFALANEAVSLAQRREQMRDKIAVAHRRYAAIAAQALAAAREEKIVELRRLCNGVLPWGWENTIGEALLVEREKATWRPALLNEPAEREELAPVARTSDVLRGLVRREVGFSE